MIYKAVLAVSIAFAPLVQWIMVWWTTDEDTHSKIATIILSYKEF